MAPYRATMASRQSAMPRYDLDYTGAMIPSPRDFDQRIWPGLWWASQQQAKLDAYDAWCRDKDVQVEQNERNMVALHRAQEAQVQLSDRNFWTTFETASADAADRVNDRRAIIEGVPVANALRDLNADDSAERTDMWRRHWDQHMEESQRRLEELHTAQDNMGHIADHAVNNYRFYGPIATRSATGRLLEREAAEEARRKVVVRRAQEESSERLTATMYHMTRATLDDEKAMKEASFWHEQTALCERRLHEVKAENKELQRAFEHAVEEDKKARNEERELEAADRRAMYEQLATVRKNRKTAEEDADAAERKRREAEMDSHMADYKAVERAGLEAEVEIKTKEMAVLSRVMSHQG